MCEQQAKHRLQLSETNCQTVNTGQCHCQCHVTVSLSTRDTVNTNEEFTYQETKAAHVKNELDSKNL